jgi:hypothetical protein
MRAKSSGPVRAPEIELRPDGWERFREAVHVAAKTPAKHRTAPSPKPKGRPASKGLNKDKSRGRGMQSDAFKNAEQNPRVGDDIDAAIEAGIEREWRKSCDFLRRISRDEAPGRKMLRGSARDRY